jgi:hypothetical protein
MPKHKAAVKATITAARPKTAKRAAAGSPTTADAPPVPEAHTLAPSKRDQASKRGGSKIDTLIRLMKTKSGATIDQLVRATGWQPHSVRGAISGTVKKKLGLDVQSVRVNGARVYRIGK